MDGTDYTQSTALLRYAGKLGGTYPECPLAALKVDEIMMIAEDVFINLFSTMGEKDEAKKVHALGHVNGNGNRKQNGAGNSTGEELDHGDGKVYSIGNVNHTGNG